MDKNIARTFEDVGKRKHQRNWKCLETGRLHGYHAYMLHLPTCEKCRKQTQEE